MLMSGQRPAGAALGKKDAIQRRSQARAQWSGWQIGAKDHKQQACFLLKLKDVRGFHTGSLDAGGQADGTYAAAPIWEAGMLSPPA
jgi:hypothetical protein